MVTRAGRDFEALYRLVREDIFAYAQALGFSPTWQQAAILQQVQAYNGGRGYMAIKSGQGTGKTACSFVAATWRALQHPGALVVLTAPTMRQCRDVWLAEGRRILAKADPALRRIIEITGSRVDICGGRQGPHKVDWGVNTVTATDERNAQGYHEPHLTVIFEEFSGIMRPIVTQFKGTATNPDFLMLGIGNPNLRDCAMFDCFNAQALRNGGDWWNYTMNAEETSRDYPHFRDPLVNEQLAREFGRESDVYRIRVLGEFPLQDPDCVISAEDLEACTKVDLMWAASLERLDMGKMRRARQLGIDFSRFGGDESAIYQRLGNAIIDWWAKSHVEPEHVVDLSIRMQTGLGWANDTTLFVADAGGMGQPLMNRYRRGKKRLREFHTSNVAIEKHYANAMTEAWFHVGRLAKARRLHIPKDDRLITQLSTRRYTTNKHGQLVLWSKDDYMDEGHDSPDRAEACSMALYDAIAVGGQHVRQGPSPRRRFVR